MREEIRVARDAWQLALVEWPDWWLPAHERRTHWYVAAVDKGDGHITILTPATTRAHAEDLLAHPERIDMEIDTWQKDHARRPRDAREADRCVEQVIAARRAHAAKLKAASEAAAAKYQHARPAPSDPFAPKPIKKEEDELDLGAAVRDVVNSSQRAD